MSCTKYFCRNGKNYLATEEGVYAVLEDLDGEEHEEEDSEDLFPTDSKKPRISLNRQEETSNLQLVYKYKKPASAFAVVDNLLFSLHQKQRSFHIESTDIETFSCLHPCILKWEAAETSDRDEVWMLALRADNTKDSFRRSFSQPWPDDHGVVLMVKVPKSPVFCLSMDANAGSYGVRENLEGNESRVEVYLKVYKATKTDVDLHESDAYTCYFKSQKADVRDLKENYPVPHILDIQPFSDGFLLLLSSGEVIQYHKRGKTMTKRELGVSNIVQIFVDRSSGSAGIMDVMGIVYNFPLPFVEPPKEFSMPEKENSNQEEIVQEILKISDTVDHVNDLRAQQEVILDQLRVSARMIALQDLESVFRVSCGVVPVESVGSVKHQVSLRMDNTSDMTFLGDHWQVLFSISVEGLAFRGHHISRPMPDSFGPGASWTVFFDFPKEFGSPEYLPVRVKCRFCFSMDFADSQEVWSRELLCCSLGALDFVHVKSTISSAAKPSEPPEQTFASFVRSIDAERSPSTPRVDAKPLTFTLSREFMKSHCELPVLSYIISKLSESTEFTVNANLFQTALSFRIIATNSSIVDVTLSGTCVKSLIAVKEHAFHLQKPAGRIDLTDEEHHAMMASIAEIRHQLEALDETEDSVEMIERLRRQLREKVSKKLSAAVVEDI